MRDAKSMQKLANLISGKKVTKILAKDVYGTGGFDIVFQDGEVLELYSVPGESEILWCVVPERRLQPTDLEFNDKLH